MSEWKSGKVIKDPKNWVKIEEVNMILDLAAQHNPRNYLLLFLLFRTGRRISELLRLKVGDINFKQKMILWNIDKKHTRLKDPMDDTKFWMMPDKKGKERYVTKKIFLTSWKPIDTAACDKLRNYILDNNLKPENYVFSSPYKPDKPLTRIAVWIFLSKYAKKLKIKIHPHSLRHCFAIAVAGKMKNPNDLVKLRDMLEHSTIQVTEGYLQFAPKESKKLLEETFGELPEIEEYEE